MGSNKIDKDIQNVQSQLSNNLKGKENSTKINPELVEKYIQYIQNKYQKKD